MTDETKNKLQLAIDAVDSTIRNRKTRKVLRVTPGPVQLSAEAIANRDEQVSESIGVAGWAPFHYDRKRNECAEPWRFTLFFHQACQRLSDRFFELFTDIKPTNKIPRMLQACGALVLVSWIPENDAAPEKINQVNEEHLAAASAATQNLMLALEVRGLGSYWSSGGVLGSPPFFAEHGMAPDEKLIAAVFVHYPGLYSDDTLEIIEGKNRQKRSASEKWTRIID